MWVYPLKGTIVRGWWTGPVPPIPATEVTSEKPSLKETEDKVSKWFQDQKETDGRQ